MHGNLYSNRHWITGRFGLLFISLILVALLLLAILGLDKLDLFQRGILAVIGIPAVICIYICSYQLATKLDNAVLRIAALEENLPINLDPFDLNKP